MTNTQILAAANAVQAAAAGAIRRRAVVLRDEFGPVRGRPFLTGQPDVVAAVDVDELGHHLSRRSAIAWSAC